MVSPTNTGTAVPVSISVALSATAFSVIGEVVLPVALTSTASPTAASTQLLRRVRFTSRRVLVWVQLMAVSAGSTVSVVPLSGTVLPVQANVLS